MAYIFLQFCVQFETYSSAVDKRRSSSCKKHMNSEQALVHQSFNVLFLSRIISLDGAVASGDLARLASISTLDPVDGAQHLPVSLSICLYPRLP